MMTHGHFLWLAGGHWTGTDQACSNGRVHKRCILDGDGIVQAFRFTDRGVHFRNKFNRMGKFREEEGAGVYRCAKGRRAAEAVIRAQGA